MAISDETENVMRDVPIDRGLGNGGRPTPGNRHPCALGCPEDELSRLERRGAYRDLTDIFRCAGVGEAMRVLDIGAGNALLIAGAPGFVSRWPG
jgi:hypothetical protein